MAFLKITNSNKKFYFKKSITDEDDFLQITIPPSAHEIESLNNEIKKVIPEQGHFSEDTYPFTIKPNFSTLGSIIEINPQGPIVSFASEDSMKNLLGFDETIFYKKYNPSPNPVEIISFDNAFIECDITKGMIFKGKRSGIIHNFTMDVNPGYKYIEKFRGNIQLYLMESKYIISDIGLKLKNESGNLVSFNGQCYI